MANDLRVPSDPLFSAFGVPATVTRPAPDDDPIETTGVWISPDPMEVPSETEFQRVERRHVLALQRSAVATAPRGTRVLAALTKGGTVRTWQADGVTRADDPDLHYVLLLPVGEES